MTPAEPKQITQEHGGPRKLASTLQVGKDRVYRRISGETPIGHRDELATRMVTDTMLEVPQSWP